MVTCLKCEQCSREKRKAAALELGANNSLTECKWCMLLSRTAKLEITNHSNVITPR